PELHKFVAVSETLLDGFRPLKSEQRSLQSFEKQISIGKGARERDSFARGFGRCLTLARRGKRPAERGQSLDPERGIAGRRGAHPVFEKEHGRFGGDSIPARHAGKLPRRANYRFRRVQKLRELGRADERGLRLEMFAQVALRLCKRDQNRELPL